MNKIIACIDSSPHADYVCRLAAWAAEKNSMNIALLHVVAQQGGASSTGDLSGSIGLGAKSALLKELAEMDEAQGKLELKKGQLMLAHAKSELAALGITAVENLHRRGDLAETLHELHSNAGLVVMGKRGENTAAAPEHLGSNLERVARTLNAPLLVAHENLQPVTRFLIAYDGGASCRKAVEYITANPLLKGAECHLLTIGDADSPAAKALQQAEDSLKHAGYDVKSTLTQDKPVYETVAAYSSAHDINLLVIGAYGHSKLRSLFLGSTTTALIRSAKTPVLLFR